MQQMVLMRRGVLWGGPAAGLQPQRLPSSRMLLAAGCPAGPEESAMTASLNAQLKDACRLVGVANEPAAKWQHLQSGWSSEAAMALEPLFLWLNALRSCFA